MATNVKKIALYPAVFIHAALYVGLQILLSSLSIPRLLHQHVIHDGAVAERKYRANGAYGFVTGATDGIGKALAEELASRGWNLILHGRSTARLQPLIDSLSAAYPTQIFLPLVANASKSPEELDLAHEVELLKAKHCVVTLLINNAGVYRP